MAPSYVLAIDQGTSSSRALLFDKDGQVKAMQQEKHHQYYPQAGLVEHDPKEILASVLSCAEAALKKVGATKDDIASIAITNQRMTLVAWDSVTGEPLYKALVWMDLRASDITRELCQGKSAERICRVTGLSRILPYVPAVKMRWLLENVPEIRKASQEGRLRFGTIDSWLLYALTGGKEGGIHVTDLTNASIYMLMDISSCTWDENICSEMGIPLDTLPAIKSNSEVYGCVKGIPFLEGLPISCCIGDQQAALLGQGCLAPGTSKSTFGTSCCMLLNTGKDAKRSENGLHTTVAFKLGEDAEVTYALEGSIACAGRVVDWLKDNLGIISSRSEVETYARRVEDTGGLTLVPAFTGLCTPHWREDARAVAVGMTLFTKKEHLCRAALECCAFQNAEARQAMMADTGFKLENLRVDGGMTANTLLLQMLSDVMDISVLRCKMPEATALGAAFAAGLSSGFYSEQDIKKMINTGGGYETFRPAMTPEVRRQHLARWADAVSRSFELDKWNPMQDRNEDEPAKKKLRV